LVRGSSPMGSDADMAAGLRGTGDSLWLCARPLSACADACRRADATSSSPWPIWPSPGAGPCRCPRPSSSSRCAAARRASCRGRCCCRRRSPVTSLSRPRIHVKEAECDLEALQAQVGTRSKLHFLFSGGSRRGPPSPSNHWPFRRRRSACASGRSLCQE
jgi:hypothetical protein